MSDVLRISPRLRELAHTRYWNQVYGARIESLSKGALRALMRMCAIRVGHLCTVPDRAARVVVSGVLISEGEYLENFPEGAVPYVRGDSDYARMAWEFALNSLQIQWCREVLIGKASATCSSARDALRKADEDEFDVSDIIDHVYESRLRADYWYES